MTAGYLRAILERKRREIEEARGKREAFGAPGAGSRPTASTEGAGESISPIGTPDGELFEQALRHPGISLIAEIKRRSPSRPSIRPDLDPAETAVAFERGGARAISVLTDGPGFGGSLEDMAAVRKVTTLPILRKDFIIDPVQIEEAAAWGANAVLLIVAALERSELAELFAQANARGLAALVEVHSEKELEAALAAGARIVGVNNRNLHTFEVDLATSMRLAPEIPEEVVSVAESGISTRAEVEALADAGYDAVLVGESLLVCGDVEAAVRSLV